MAPGVKHCEEVIPGAERCLDGKAAQEDVALVLVDVAVGAVAVETGLHNVTATVLVSRVVRRGDRAVHLGRGWAGRREADDGE